MRRLGGPVPASVLVSVALLLAGCGGGGGEPAAAGQDLGKLEITLPSQILGLRVSVEQPSTGLQDVERPYFDAVALFSLRENDLLRASLQIARFNAFGRPGSSSFRKQILGQIGSTPPEPMRVGQHTVYFTSGNRQSIFIWFKGRGIFVLIAHQEYLFPRTLLRRVVDLEDLKV